MKNRRRLLSLRKDLSLRKVMVSTLLIFSLLLTPVMAQSESTELGIPPLTSEHVSAFLNDVLTDPSVAPLYHGAAVTIVKDGEVLVQEGFGFSDIENQEAVDPDKTVFRIASVSKSLTAVAVMQLVEQGLIDLEADIRQYLGDIDYENPFEQPVTMQHLLSHTSGFEIRDPEVTHFHDDFELFVEIEDFVRAYMPSVVREPGTAYMYGNFDSLLQGLIVQNVSGEPFESYMENHIFGPIGMTDSGFILEGTLKDNLATGYDAVGNPIDAYAVTPTVMPHGGMLTTASDMGKFMIAFLNDGLIGSEQLLSKESIQEMIAYRTSSHTLLPNTTYGFEAPIQLPGAGRSEHVITKAGDLVGFSSYLLFIPEENMGIFVTYNNNGPLREVLYSALLSTFLPQYATPAELEEFVPSDLSRFEGLYVDLRLPSIVNTITVLDEGLLIIANAFMGERALFQVDELLFADINGMLYGFLEDEDHAIIYLDEPYLNPLGYARKTAPAAGFIDVEADHPFSEYIHAMQSYGLYPNDASESFEPERPVTRAEYIKNLMLISGLKGSEHPPVFTDVIDHPEAPYIQFAYEMGLIQGNGKGQFYPDRPITRQEAATIVWRSYAAIYPPDYFDDFELSGSTDEWAVSAVQLMIGLELYGPEVQLNDDGTFDFHSTQPMLRQEEAAHHYLLLTKPTLNFAGGEAEDIE